MCALQSIDYPIEPKFSISKLASYTWQWVTWCPTQSIDFSVKLPSYVSEWILCIKK